MQIHSVGIVGYGDFGQFLYSLARERYPDLLVKVFSSKQARDEVTFFSLEEVCQTDLLILCVPISAFGEMIDTILPLLGEQTVVCDVATVKKHTVSILKDKQVPRYIATHPMFGPYSYAKHGNLLKDLRIVVCDSSLTKATMDVIIDFLKQASLQVLELGVDEHDRMVAETLFLTHLVGQTVNKGGFKRTSIDTVSFGFLMDAVESVAHDESLFHDVYTFNPYCKEVLSRFQKVEADIKASLG